MTTISVSLNSYAKTDLNDKFKYCTEERDQAYKTLDICDETLTDCKVVNTLLQDQVTKQAEIIETQTVESTDQKEQITDLKKSNTTGRILFGVLGLALGLILPIPIPFFF